MILDGQLELSSEQTVTAAAASENIIDLGIARDIGIGESLWIRIGVTETMDDSGDDSTLAVILQTDDNVAFGSAVTVAALVTIPAVTAAGTEYFFRLPAAVLNEYERYIRGFYTPANGNLSAGKFDMNIIKDIQHYTDYTSGFTIS